MSYLQNFFHHKYPMDIRSVSKIQKNFSVLKPLSRFYGILGEHNVAPLKMP